MSLIKNSVLLSGFMFLGFFNSTALENQDTELATLETNLEISLNLKKLELEKNIIENTSDYISTNFKLKDAEANDIAKIIYFAAMEFEIPIEKLVALIAIESGFKSSAKSSEGAIGLAQVKQSVWQGYLDRDYDLYSPDDNVLAGAEILTKYKEKCGNWSCALKAYNVGITNYMRNVSTTAMNRYIKKINHRENEVKEFFLTMN